MSTTEIREPEQARPWRPGDGPEPTVTTWPAGDRPALRVWSHGSWRYAPVLALQEWADGTIVYQVSVDLRGDTAVTTCLYRWPQEGLRSAHVSTTRPSTDAGVARGDMPRPRPPVDKAGRTGARDRRHAVSGEAVSGERPSFACPVCTHTSHHPQDAENEYCGHCRRFTAAEQRAAHARDGLAAARQHADDR
ncbi:hypothetical protein [Streptomyces sp. MZ04]|uniref:hypothetical protein n=1 Tax=Streptomyces sp. MZ04 TaxID=2559236 RepID=UPI00107E9808|nr:hypothetical protein [Streptomyces sp. MZ04]TGB03225.1 hypothetical protein E2651_25700 [Streptomyces sp. MZ04]